MIVEQRNACMEGSSLNLSDLKVLAMKRVLSIISVLVNRAWAANGVRARIKARIVTMRHGFYDRLSEGYSSSLTLSVKRSTVSINCEALGCVLWS